MNKLRLDLPIAWGATIEKVAKDNILPQSKNEVPVDTGALKSTGRVTKPQASPTGTVIKVTIAYGGQLGTGDIGTSGRLHIKKWVDYAVVQHEANYSHRVGKKKYLEDPAYRAHPVIWNYLKVQSNRVLYAIFK